MYGDYGSDGDGDGDGYVMTMVMVMVMVWRPLAAVGAEPRVWWNPRRPWKPR